MNYIIICCYRFLVIVILVAVGITERDFERVECQKKIHVQYLSEEHRLLSVYISYHLHKYTGKNKKIKVKKA
jgi:hypothetical protein